MAAAARALFVVSFVAACDAERSPAAVASAAPTVAATATATATATAAAPSAARTCPDGMAGIEAGKARVIRLDGGGSRVEPVAAFCLAKREVTLGEYRACAGSGACAGAVDRAQWDSVDESRRASAFCNARHAGRDAHPVNCASVDDARAFCASRGARLPTLGELALAALGGARFYTWAGTQIPDGVCWGRPRKRDSTCAAGANAVDVTPEGVVDLAGNVSEWAADGRAFGASFYAVDDGYLKKTLEGFTTPSPRNETLGFRCAADRVP